MTSEKPAKVTFAFGCPLKEIPDGQIPKLTLHLQFDRIEAGQVVVRLNGNLLTGSGAADQWLEFPLESQHLKLGQNEVEVSLSGESASTELSDLRCTVRWP